MKIRPLLALFIIAILLNIIPLLFQTVPGYMDAEYYFANGLRLFDGYGFSEPFVWNYLNDPTTLPQPSHTYWMPLTSIVSCLGMAIFKSKDFIASRTLFLLISAIVPVLTSLISFQISKNKKVALFAGGLSLFPGFYFPYLTITDSFSLYMVLGSSILFLLLIREQFNTKVKKIIFLSTLGILAGLMHLARADGILWIPLMIAFLFLVGLREHDKKSNVSENRYLNLALGVFIPLLGYVLITFFWYMRNIELFGALFPPSGGKALWLTEYNQLFTYPIDGLNYSNWIASGWGQIFVDRLDALILNLKTAIGVQAEIFLLPFILIGLYKKKHNLPVLFITFVWLVFLLVMSFIFPYAGARGGFFHAGSAFQPLLWALGAEGFCFAIRYGHKKRNWHLDQAFTVLGVGFICVAVLYTGIVVKTKIIGEDMDAKIWNASSTHYNDIHEFLRKQEKCQQETILIKNPPRYFLTSGNEAIVIPEDSTESLLEVANLFDAKCLVLERDHVNGLDFLYNDPDAATEIDYLGCVKKTKVFYIESQ